MHDKATNLSPAPLLVRIAAMIYEFLLIFALVAMAALPFLYFSHVASDKAGWLYLSGWLHLAFQIYLLLVLFAYFSAFWLRSGQTLAMKTWRIRLIQQNGSTLTFRQAAFRFALALPGLLLAGLGFWWALIDRDKQFLHDRIVGTRLVRVPRKT